jgi:hypothetical protein
VQSLEVQSKECRTEMLSVAQKIINGEIDLLDGSRLMDALRLEAGLDAGCEMFHVFMTVACDLDRIPIGKSDESLWAASFWKKCLEEKNAYLALAKEDIIDAASEVVRYLRSRSE